MINASVKIIVFEVMKIDMDRRMLGRTSSKTTVVRGDSLSLASMPGVVLDWCGARLVWCCKVE